MKLSRGKMIFVGLAAMVCAKAAISFPDLPKPWQETAPLPGQPLMAAAAAEEPAEVEEDDVPPPVVSGLSATPAQCEAPEEVLLALSRERELVAEQNKKLDIRESEISLAREKLEIEKSALVELKDSIEMLLKKVEQQQTDDLDRLISFYQNMKPAEAARIMDDLDIEVTIMVLGTMKPRTAAPIMAKMAPVRARAISKIILERSQLPGDQDLVGIKLN